MADPPHSALSANRSINACKTNPHPQMVFHPTVDESVLSEKTAAFFPPVDVTSTAKDEREIAISLEKRRPFKELTKDQSRGTYERQVSYFSESSAQLQREKSARFQKYYQTELGRTYRYNYGALVETVHQAPDSGSVTCVDYSSDGRHLAHGFGNGLVKVLKSDSNLTTVIDARKQHSRDRVTRVKLFGFRHLYLVFCNRKGRIYLSRYYSDSQDLGEGEEGDADNTTYRCTVDEEYGEGAGGRGTSKLDEYAFSARSIRMKNKTVPDDSLDIKQRALKKEKDELDKLKTIRDKQTKQFDTNEQGVLWKCHLFANENNELEALDVDVSSTHLITGGKDATVRLYDINMGKIIKEYSSHQRDCFLTYSSPDADGPIHNEGHFLRVHALRFSDVSGNIFASGGLDGVVKIWDTRSSHAVRNLVGPMICGDSLDIMDYKLICGQWTCKSSLELFDLRTFTPMSIVPTNRKIGSLSEYPYCCKFLRGWGSFQGVEITDGDLILSGHANSLEITSINEKKVVKAFPIEGNVVAVTNYMQTIVAATSDNALAFYSFIPNEYAAVHVFNIKDFEPIVEDDEDELDISAAVFEKKTDLYTLWTAKFGDLWAVKKDEEFVKYVDKVKRVMKALACEGVSREGEPDRKNLLKTQEKGIFSVLSEERTADGSVISGMTDRRETTQERKKTSVEAVLMDIDPKRLDDVNDRKFVKKTKAKVSAERIRQNDAKIVKEIDGAFQDEAEEIEEILEFSEKPQMSEIEPFRIEQGGRKKKQVSILDKR